MKYLLGLILIFTGCATITFTKPGYTPEQYNLDINACKAQAFGNPNPFLARDQARACMAGKGYQEK